MSLHRKNIKKTTPDYFIKPCLLNAEHRFHTVRPLRQRCKNVHTVLVNKLTLYEVAWPFSKLRFNPTWLEHHAK